MSVTEIFKLNPVLDNPIFDGFGWGNRPSCIGIGRLADDFYPLKREEWNWEAKRLSEHWKPPVVIGDVSVFNDYPCVGLMIPALSGRAVAGLKDFLEPNGELLPLKCESNDQEYFAYNCTRIVDILDQEKSTGAVWIQKKPGLPACAIDINYFPIYANAVEGLTIFRMRELCTWICVSNLFVERVRELGLNGFEFTKIWPLPEGSNFRQLARSTAEKDSSTSIPSSTNQQSLFIDFWTKEKKPSNEERKRIARFEKEIRAQLLVRRVDGSPHGTLEKRLTNEGFIRLVLSCPDAQRLFDKLRHWLSSLLWEPRPRVLVRRSKWDDTLERGDSVEI